jgi:UPF0755 protein
MKLALSKKNLLGISLFLMLVVSLPLNIYIIFLLSSPGTGKNVRILDFRDGYTLKKVAGELKQSRIISSEWLFILYARLQGADDKVKAGTYQFNDGMKPANILHKLITGEVYNCRFAVPEGYSIYQIAVLLENRGLFRKDAFLAQCFNRSVLAELGIKGSSIEGYLYPSTYNLTPHTTEVDLIREMVKQFKKHFSPEMGIKAKMLRMDTNEILTLASMVEKEAVAPAERPLIASVFHNRLNKKMPLQSDPTAVYRLRAFAGKISKQDIQSDSPYNTYRISGLPPGPIGNPGSEAINAVLSPAKTKYLYFVAKLDGTHYFSTTLDEHNRAVQKYLKFGAGVAESAEPTVPEYRNEYPIIKRGVDSRTVSP